MPETKRKPRAPRTTRPQPRLTAIEGALSIYRPGDIITFTLAGVTFNAPVITSYLSNGTPYISVELRLGIHSGTVTRVERAGSAVR
jgi:hypothetical protein